MKILKTIALTLTMTLAFSTMVMATGAGTSAQKVRNAVSEKAQGAYELFSRNSEAEGTVYVIFQVNEQSEIEVMNVYGPAGVQLWGLTIAALNGKSIDADPEMTGKNLKMKITYEQAN